MMIVEMCCIVVIVVGYGYIYVAIEHEISLEGMQMLERCRRMHCKMRIVG